MEHAASPGGRPVTPYRKSIRLTFRIADGEVRLLSHERLPMICPPSVGERPQAGKHSGFWMELRDAKDHVLFHRVLDNPLGDSVEVHSPDGKIERIFGTPAESVFEVLLPDDGQAATIALMGESLQPATARKERAVGTRELARFDIPAGMKGNEAAPQQEAP